MRKLDSDPDQEDVWEIEKQDESRDAFNIFMNLTRKICKPWSFC